MMAWIVIGCCWVTSFLFSGIEAGLLSLDQVRLRHQVKLQNHSAIMLDRLMKEPERLLATILLVTNFADIAGLLVLTRLLVTLLGTIGYPVALLDRRADLSFPARRVAEIALPALSISGPCCARRPAGFQFGPALANPRTRRPDRPASLSPNQGAAAPLRCARRFETARGRKRTPGRPYLDRARNDSQRGRFPHRQSLGRDGDRSPTLCRSNPAPAFRRLLELSSKTGVDRLPIISKKTALGLVNTFDVLLDQTPTGDLHHYSRRIISAPDNESAYRIIRRLRAARLTLAAVRGRRGQLTGIVTIEDLVRRLVQSA
jgi:hypothetical protein